MRFSTVTLATVLLGAVAAAPATTEPATRPNGFKLPGGLKDGFYRAYHDESGREVHELVREPATPKELSASSSTSTPVAEPEPEKLVHLQRRAWKYWCGCGLSMNHGDCDAAVEDLKHQSDVEYAKDYGDRKNLILPGQSFYSIRGSVVAFACNRNWNYAPVPRRDSFTQFYGEITNRCGWYVPGTWTNDNLDGGVPHVGYMNYRANLDFCQDSTQSNRDRC
ncbi:hypothetical protein Micbo1qcDRAFT_191815 [Microdochium bolleyi]|uniref:Uncharacterized protein n=1 Tax=Microdochium bolleyi TaxID=196109 RepID=A0A136JJG9_9PEZI|nr:hypothetical protein Micbo1qcDRAFT_191815 [Microdochium bolleyi]